MKARIETIKRLEQKGFSFLYSYRHNGVKSLVSRLGVSVLCSDVCSTFGTKASGEIEYPFASVTPKSPNYENSEIAFLCR